MFRLRVIPSAGSAVPVSFDCGKRIFSFNEPCLSPLKTSAETLDKTILISTLSPKNVIFACCVSNFDNLRSNIEGESISWDSKVVHDLSSLTSLCLQIVSHYTRHVKYLFTYFTLLTILTLLNRGISLLCPCSRVFSSIILLRLWKRTDEIIWEAVKLHYALFSKHSSVLNLNYR